MGSPGFISQDFLVYKLFLFHTVKYKNHTVGYIFHTVRYKYHSVKQRIYQGVVRNVLRQL